SARFPLSAPKWRRSRYRQFEAGAHDTRRATLEVIAVPSETRASNLLTRTVGAQGCGYESGTKRRVRQQGLMVGTPAPQITKQTDFGAAEHRNPAVGLNRAGPPSNSVSGRQR